MRIDKKKEQLQNLIKRKITNAEIANILGLGSGQAVLNRINRGTELKNFEILKLDEAFKTEINKTTSSKSEANLVSCTDDEIESKITAKLGRKLASRFAEIQYIEDLDNYNKPVRNPFVTEVIIDAQIIVYKWRCNIEDLRIISMFDDSMDGGEYAIKNGDILIVDTSVKTVTSSGLYLFIINDKELYIRRIIDTFRNSYIFSAKKNEYKIFEEEKTFEDLKNANFRILGRVVTDISYTI